MNDAGKHTIKEKDHTAFDISGKIYSYISMAMITCVFAFILIVVFGYGWGVWSLEFLTTEPNPSAINTDSGGILTPMIGTFILTITGIAIAFPFALATAIYLCFYTKKGIFKTLVKSAVDILAGIPTIVIALFALVIFTMPQMGFLSATVDTRINSLSGTELSYTYKKKAADQGLLGESGDFAQEEPDGGPEGAGYWNEYGEWIEADPDEIEEFAENSAGLPQGNTSVDSGEAGQWDMIRVAFENNLDARMGARRYAEIISEAFNSALAENKIPKEEIFVDADNGKLTIKLGESAAEALRFHSCTNEIVEQALGIAPGDAIYPGETGEYVVDPSKITEGSVRSYGRSFLVCGITMAIMVLPFVIKSMEEALKSVPVSYIDAALALGATKWRTIYKVVLRSAIDGLVTGVILGMGRIIGDTAIVWLTLGGSIRMTGNQPWFAPENWLSTLQNSGSTLTSYIYYTSPAGEGNQYDVAFGASLALIMIIVILNIAASAIGKAGKKKNG
jgi:ABC-type phosphate transport system permease subunit